MRAFRAASLLFFCAAAARPQSEGVAEMKGSMSLGGGKAIPSATRVYFTRDAYRMEVEVDLSAILPKGEPPAGSAPARHKTITIQKVSDLDHALLLNEARHTYAISDLKAQGETKAGRPHSTYSVKKLGKDRVGGLSCERALVTSSSGTESELCVANELVAPSSWLSSMGKRDASDAMLAALRGNGLAGFPIRLVVRAGAGKEAMSRMELARFENKTLPASLFEVPAGYTVTDEASVNLTEEQEQMMKELRAKMKSRSKP